MKRPAATRRRGVRRALHWPVASLPERTRPSLNNTGQASEPRSVCRLSDLITAAFHGACRAGNLVAAEQLVVALEYEVTRSICLTGADRRVDGDDVAAVHARLKREFTRLHVI